MVAVTNVAAEIGVSPSEIGVMLSEADALIEPLVEAGQLPTLNEIAEAPLGICGVLTCARVFLRERPAQRHCRACMSRLSPKQRWRLAARRRQLDTALEGIGTSI